MNKEPITLEGHERLKEEIHRLKTKERPRIIKAIAEARAHGDLKENAEYHAAREEQGLLEARIAELENTLALAQVIDHKALSNGHIAFGATVTLLDLQTSQQKKYQIVGKFESDIKAGKIPIASPIARALIGRKVGEEVSIQVPKGLQEFEVLKIEYL
ncbi:MAG: transcription elongation factor GreA [Deltaproteobacteria bacterium GWA2_38_16]|nr:MAG: transcription elongation factor GreA [Deltaproteobacteria bacterium GWA2_38_16]OGQ01951.1 MAG: transcription elongation factor GreA [Deltaproteobacteria bacterium RIFCSPHIGHO2_02_FULL_38_15]OGQ34935.1 MAG: transcription elongation factor GreA [Deltaproteobacteria bacterium RIFCSPLOWO2_01_FULL_38_9]OGQ63714.1 MAG: transcription elongation factor GreA [Deltaproteobacteria bacterium RIFCSPLOWO2_12_FULL_38_8]HBQ21296.1 transcription elongation factor GreA [Deltaproteobacteria bacterium]